MRDLNSMDDRPGWDGPSPYWKNNVAETPAVLPVDPELDAAVNKILEGAPYSGYGARADIPATAEPRFVPVHAAICIAFGMLVGFTASAILF